eukprot:gene13017-15379_t
MAEVMATSDNVVRAGLTPKLRDTDILCDMLTYNQHHWRQGLPTLLKGDPRDACSKHYAPPFDEFEMDIIHLSANGSYTIPAAAVRIPTDPVWS